MKGWRWPESLQSLPDSGMRAERELLNSEVIKEGVWQILILDQRLMSGLN